MQLLMKIIWTHSITALWLSLTLCGIGFSAHAADVSDGGVDWDFRLSDRTGHDVEILNNNNPLHIKTVGKDPYIYIETVQAWDSTQRDLEPLPVLELEYFSGEGSDHFQVFTVPFVSESRSVKAEGLGISQGWSRYSVDLAELNLAGLQKVGAWGLRLDLGSRAGSEFQIRRIALRSRNELEQRKLNQAEELLAADRNISARLSEYLTNRSYPASIQSVLVDEKEIKIQFSIPCDEDVSDLRIIELPMGVSRLEMEQSADWKQWSHALVQKNSLTLPRHRQNKDGEADLKNPDRLLSRWALARQTDDNSLKWLCSARYCEDPVPLRDTKLLEPANRKGIGALSMGRPLQDLDELGVGSATINFHLANVIRLNPGNDTFPFEYMGRTWHAVESTLNYWDKALLEAARRNIVVSAILLVPHAHQFTDREFGKIVAHPDADRSGIFAAPNLEDPEGALAYSAILELLAQRYCRSDGDHGRVSHWIIHNEVNSGWVWTNAGDRSAIRFMDLYQKSMRLTHLISRQYDQHSQSFISLEHHWTVTHNSHCYRGKELLEWMEKFCETEGDFEWGLAFHPYPQSLFEPKVWLDTQAQFHFDTPKITFKNLEVLDAWMRRPSALYNGQPRVIHLSEQGLNSRDYSQQSLIDQAAGMAYAWKKMEPLESIQVFHYHNWVDNRGEGGLRIGLRRFPDDADDPNGKKPIYQVFKALGTEGEMAATEFALKVIGIPDWKIIQNTPVK